MACHLTRANYLRSKSNHHSIYQYVWQPQAKQNVFCVFCFCGSKYSKYFGMLMFNTILEIVTQHGSHLLLMMVIFLFFTFLLLAQVENLIAKEPTNYL
jgi:hypothetical protein